MAGIVEDKFKSQLINSENNFRVVKCTSFENIETDVETPVVQFIKKNDTDNILIKRLHTELKNFLNEIHIDYKDMKSKGKIILSKDNNHIIADFIYKKFLSITMSEILNPDVTTYEKKVILI